MQKDVIYIDVEDDITAIISKVKAAKKTVVALVPPKRIGVLQSAVNLRLLSRAAKQNDKHLALVTSNQALVNLASSAGIPVAKNLQSKPELVKSDINDDDQEDVINGSELPIGEHAQMADQQSVKAATMAKVLDEVNDDKPEEAAPAKKKKAAPKIPNFNKFRKRLFLGISAGILLIVFLVWATVFAPRATVVISAKTTSSSVNSPVTIASDVSTSYKQARLKAVKQTDSEEKSVSFKPTGKKDAGKKATGSVSFSNSSTEAQAVQAGTKLETSGGLVFVLDSSVVVPAGSVNCQNIFNCSGVPGEAEGTLTAAENGSKYNAATGRLSGAPSAVSASLDGPTSGGVTKMVSVVTASDVQKAKQNLVDEDTNTVRDDLLAKFGDNVTGVPESFDMGYKNVESDPEVGEEAESATLKATVIYTVYGVEKNEIDTFLDEYLKNTLKGSKDQRVYENGADKVVFQEANKKQNGAVATIVATAQIGPKIEDADVKKDVRGKRYGEIQESLTSVQGIESIDVKFFPFWVSTVPDDDTKITVEFSVDEQD